MGNSNEIPTRRKIRNTPDQQFPGGPQVLGSVNEYNYYPAQYAPASQGYYMHRLNKSVLSSDTYLQNEFYGQLQANDCIKASCPAPALVQQPVPIQQPVLIQRSASIQQSNVPISHNSKKRHRHRHRRHHGSNSPNHGHRHHHHHNHDVPVPLTANLRSSPIAREHPISNSFYTNDTFHLVQKPTVVVASKKKITTPRSEYYSTPVLVKQNPPLVSTTVSSPVPVTRTTSELIPVLVTNHVVKSTDKKSIYNYEPGALSIVRQSRSQTPTTGSKWYEHDYEKRIKTLTNKNI
ncbi:unnamed protein product [Rotaria magnacalcarata]